MTRTLVRTMSLIAVVGVFGSIVSGCRTISERLLPDSSSSLNSLDARLPAQSLEERVSDAVLTDGLIVVGTIVGEIGSGTTTLEDVVPPEEIQAELDWIVEMSEIDIEHEFGPNVTPNPTQIVAKVKERGMPGVLEGLDDSFVGEPYVDFEVHVERVLHDGADFGDSKTFTLRDLFVFDDMPSSYSIGDRYLLLAYNGVGEIYETGGGLDSDYNLSKTPIESLRGTPAPFAKGLDPDGFIAAVLDAIAQAHRDSTARASRPTATPRPRVVGDLEIVGQIGGGGYGPVNTLAEHDGRLVFGLGPRLAVADMSEPAAPRVIGLSGILPRVVRGLALVSNTAYVALADRGLAVIDIAEPTAPRIVSQTQSGGAITALAHRDGLLYVMESVDHESGSLSVFDTIGGDLLTPLASLSLLPDCRAIAFVGDVAAIACAYKGVQLVDVSDPRAPRAANLVTFQSEGLEDIAAIGDYLAVPISRDQSVHVLDVSDADDPRDVARLSLPTLGSGLATYEDLLLVSAGHDGGLHVADMSDLTSPRLLSTAETLAEVVDSIVIGDMVVSVFFPKRSSSPAHLGVTDVSDATHPRSVGELVTLTRVQDVAVESGLLITSKNGAVGPSLLHAIDISTPSAPLLLDALDTALHGVWEIVIEGGMIYIADGLAGLRIIDASDPDRLTEVAHLELGVDQALGVAAADGFAYVTTSQGHVQGDDGRLHIVDVTDPGAARVIASLSLGKTCWDVEVDGNIVVVATDELIKLVDVSDKTRPEVVGTVPNIVTHRVLISDHLLIVRGAQDIELIDISDPAAPFTVGHVPAPMSQWGMNAGDGRLYITDRGFSVTEQGGVHVFDITDPSQPREIGYIETPDEPEGVAATNDHVFVADSAGGVSIIHLGGE